MAAEEISEKELLEQARKAEQDELPENAIPIYERLIKKEPLKDLFYDRLMILYRKLKNYKKELEVIDKGIKAFETYFKERAEKVLKKNKHLEKLSMALLKKTGLKEKNHEYFPEPLNRWRKRKVVVKRKLQLA
jgi:tetratricopeptide (TPR) repeat protein